MRLHSRYFIFVLGFNLLSSFGFAKANFPARGFAPVLDVEQAEDRLKQFKLSFFGLPKESFHQAYSYRFQFAHYPQSGAARNTSWVFIRAIPTFAYFSHRPDYQSSGLKSFVFFFIDPRS